MRTHGGPMETPWRPMDTPWLGKKDCVRMQLMKQLRFAVAIAEIPIAIAELLNRGVQETTVCGRTVLASRLVRSSFPGLQANASQRSKAY